MRCLLIVLALPAAPLVAQKSLTPFASGKAVAILRQQASCLGCHELNGEGGRVAPSLTDVEKRRSAAYIRAMIDDPQGVVTGATMPKTRLDSATKALISAYLARDASPGPLPQSTVPVSRVADPASLYMKWCASCHGQSGAGDG